MKIARQSSRAIFQGIGVGVEEEPQNNKICSVAQLRIHRAMAAKLQKEGRFPALESVLAFS